MTLRRDRRLGRLWRALAVMVTASLLLSGCVYFRLLELKKQLADFDRHFTVQTAEGLRLNFLHPVLRQDDIRWLGFSPSSKRAAGKAEQWRMRWIKQPAPGVREANPFEIVFDFYFTDGKLSGLTFSESYFALMPKQVVVASIRSLGGANVDQKNRSVESTVALADRDVPPPVRPNRAMLTALLGLPTEQSTDGVTTTLRYLCLPDAPDGKGKEIDLRLVFDAKTDALLRTTGRMPLGKVDLNFTTPPDAPASQASKSAAAMPAAKI